MLGCARWLVTDESGSGRSERGAHFLTPPIDRGQETRCYLRDPDGNLIEVGQNNRTDGSADG